LSYQHQTWYTYDSHSVWVNPENRSKGQKSHGYENCHGRMAAVAAMLLLPVGAARLMTA